MWLALFGMVFHYSLGIYMIHPHTKLEFSIFIHCCIHLMAFFSRTTWVSQHQKGKPFWILMKQEIMGWQWHQLDHMQIICTLLLTDNHTSYFTTQFLQARCPSCCPTNSVKALKAEPTTKIWKEMQNVEIGWFGWLGITQYHRQCHHLIECIRLPISGLSRGLVCIILS